MAGGDRLFRPKETGVRDPISNVQENGRIVNPPRFAGIGGLTSKAKGFKKNDKMIRKPGFEK